MDYLTVAQAAERLGTSAQMVRRWIRDGSLDAERVGRMYLLRPGSVQRFKRLPRGRPFARWFRAHDAARIWHATERLSVDEAGMTMCGERFDLTGSSELEDKPRPSGSDVVCPDCAKSWGRKQVRVMLNAIGGTR